MVALPDGVLPALAAGLRSRAAAAGIDPHQYDAVTARLTGPHDWSGAFMDVGREHLDRARQARAAHHGVTAGEAYLAASAWFHFATMLPAATPDPAHPDRPDPAHPEPAHPAPEPAHPAPDPAHPGHRAAGDAMRRALGHLDPTATRLSGHSFTGLLRRPTDADAPLVVIVPGLDSAKEEFHSVSEALLRRGLATLAVDGPGQGELAPSTTPTGDYHRVVAEVLDLLLEAPWRPSSIGMLALGLGGYYGALTLASEPRLRAGVVVSGPYAMDWTELPPLLRDVLIQRTGGLDAARRFTARIRLEDVAPLIEQPMFVVDGGLDIVPGVENGRSLADRAPHGQFLLVPEGDHLIGNARWKWLPAVADRLAAHLRS